MCSLLPAPILRLSLFFCASHFTSLSLPLSRCHLLFFSPNTLLAFFSHCLGETKKDSPCPTSSLAAESLKCPVQCLKNFYNPRDLLQIVAVTQATEIRSGRYWLYWLALSFPRSAAGQYSHVMERGNEFQQLCTVAAVQVRQKWAAKLGMSVKTWACL